MVLFICPRCQVRLAASSMSGKDFVHECNSGKPVFDQEDVVVTTTSTDEFNDANTSTGKLDGDIMHQGQGNKLWGKRGWIEGDKVEDVTVRGNSKETHRQRKHFEYIPDVKALDRRGK